MGTSYDIKEKVYVALVDNSEALEQSNLTYEDTKDTRTYISLKQDRFITDSHYTNFKQSSKVFYIYCVLACTMWLYNNPTTSTEE